MMENMNSARIIPNSGNVSKTFEGLGGARWFKKKTQHAIETLRISKKIMFNIKRLKFVVQNY